MHLLSCVEENEATLLQSHCPPTVRQVKDYTLYIQMPYLEGRESSKHYSGSKIVRTKHIFFLFFHLCFEIKQKQGKEMM